MHTRFASLLVVALALVTGAPPSRAAVGPAGAKAYVTNSGSDTVSVIDLTNMTVITTLNVGDEPHGLAATPDGAFVYVADRFGSILEGSSVSPSVSIISTATDQVVGVVGITGTQPLDCAVTPDGRFVYVVCSQSSTVSVISTTTNLEVKSISLARPGGFPEGIAITPDGSKVYVADNDNQAVEVISAATNEVLGSPIDVGVFPRQVKVSSDGTKVIVVSSDAPVIIRTSDDTVIPTAFDDIGDQTDVAVSGNLAYVTNRFYAPPQQSDAKPSGPKSAASFGDASLDVYDLSAETYVESIQVFGEAAVAVDLLRDGSCAYVAGDGEGTSLQAIDLEAGDDIDNGANVDSGPRGVAVVQPRPIVNSFFLPKKLAYKAAGAKSKLKASGFLDLGSGEVDLTASATLTVGTVPFPIPTLTASTNGRTFTYTQGSLKFVVVKNPFGSSRAKFRLENTGDLGASVPSDGTVEVRFQNAAVDAVTEILLQAGGFRLGKKRGALSKPNLFVVRAAADVPGNSRDTLSLIVGLATGGVTPPAAPEVRVEFGSTLKATIPAASFTRKGDVYSFKGDVNGVTSVSVDFLRETVTIGGRGLDLGAFPAGQSPLTIFVGVGADDRGVAVRVARQGNVLKY